MLEDAEFAALLRIPAESVEEISADVAPFTFFSLRTNVLKKDGKTANVDLWHVQKTSAPNIRKLVEADHAATKAANLKRYIAQGYAFERQD